jgi:hypothetical protein
VHRSWFRIVDVADDDNSGELNLPADFSEWLFHVQFWKKLGNAEGVILDQFEEGDLGKNLLPLSIDLLVSELSAIETHAGEIRFSWGWDQSGRELVCAIEASALRAGLVQMIEFFGRARSIHSDIFCSL